MDKETKSKGYLEGRREGEQRGTLGFFVGCKR